MSFRSAFFVCLFAVALLPVNVHADVIFDNGGPDASLGGVDSTVFTSLNPDFAVFADFELEAGASNLTDIHWWGNYYTYFEDTIDDNFTIYIFADDGGLPDLSGGLLYTIDGSTATRTDTGLDVGGDTEMPIFEYDLILDTPIALDPDTTYWLSITHDFHWRWQTSVEAGTAYQVGGLNFPDDFADWEEGLDDVSFDVAFYLTGGDVVPEPSSLLLLGIGIAALARARRRG